MSETFVHIDKVIANRKTAKTLAPIDQPLPIEGSASRAQVDKWVRVAGNAPFHKPSHKTHHEDEPIFEPWRVWKLDAQHCRQTCEEMQEDNIGSELLWRMFNAADAVMLVSALPNPSEKKLNEGELFEANIDNMEHVIAASCFCQSALLAAEADGFGTYWSTGGPLRESWGQDKFGIPKNQIFIGALFFFPAEETLPEGVEVKPGSLRSKRAHHDKWSKWS